MNRPKYDDYAYVSSYCRALEQYCNEIEERNLKKAPVLNRLPRFRMKMYCCPNCGTWLLYEDEVPNECDNYCSKCGQLIDWKGINDESST